MTLEIFMPLWAACGLFAIVFGIWIKNNEDKLSYFQAQMFWSVPVVIVLGFPVSFCMVNL